jgi:hypothetical protein
MTLSFDIILWQASYLENFCLIQKKHCQTNLAVQVSSCPYRALRESPDYLHWSWRRGATAPGSSKAQSREVDDLECGAAAPTKEARSPSLRAHLAPRYSRQMGAAGRVPLGSCSPSVDGELREDTHTGNVRYLCGTALEWV